MDYIEKKAYAKINIALDVLRKRADGYHDMKMVMQTLDIFDVIRIKKTNNCEIVLRSNVDITENIENNLVYKACVDVLNKVDLYGKVGFEVYIEKNIPMGAGMAGGSSDCATTIVAINELLGLELTLDEMIEIGKKLGSDVPYCLVGGTKLVEGVGDIITDIKDHPQTVVLAAKPIQSVSTKKIFEALELDTIKNRPNFEKMISAINEEDVKEVAKYFCNVFEEVTIPMYSEIGDIKNFLKENGAINSLMTGTGSTVFGYFENLEKAEETAKKVEKSFDLELVVVSSVICNNFNNNF